MKELGDETRKIVEGCARFWDAALAGLRDLHQPIRHSGATRVKTEEEIRADVQQWFRMWSRTASKRLCTLLVTGYFRTRGPFGVEGEEKYLQLRQPHGLAFLQWVEESADRPLTASESATAVREGVAACRLFRRDAIASEDQPQFNSEALIDCLWEPLNDPLRAANRLALADDLPLLLPGLQQVRECFCPAGWHAPPKWTPPAEAVSWAQRIYDQRAFGELPILADMLEDADCPDRPLLNHCRNCKAHFRGCAALDRLLGKA